MKSVSIIMTVYKKEKYLADCIQNILDQTFKDFELICINDCSPDGSLTILETFSSEDDRIKIINNEKNMGAAYSRNIGVNMAEGEYVLIVDSDDIFAPELVATAYEECKRRQLDVVLFDYDIYNNNTGDITECSMPFPISKRQKNKIFNKSDVEQFGFQMSLAAPWTKMYRREFLKKYHLCFQNLSSSNDVFFGKMVLVQADRIGYLGKSLVRYRKNIEGQISNNKREAALNFAKAMLAVKEKLNNEKIYKKYAKSYNTYVLQTLIMHFSDTEKESRAIMYHQIEKTTSQIFDKSALEEGFLNQYFFVWLHDFVNVPLEQHLNQEIYNGYKYLFQIEKEKIDELKNYIKDKDAKIALWGYGKNGKLFERECAKKNIKIDCIIDRNYENMMEPNIYSPNIIADGKYIILVTRAAYVKEILKSIQDIKGESLLFDVQSYFTYGFELSECTF